MFAVVSIVLARPVQHNALIERSIEKRKEKRESYYKTSLKATIPEYKREARIK
jgi:hypothetical protein